MMTCTYTCVPMQLIIGCARLADDAMEHSLDALFSVWMCTLAIAYLMEKELQCHSL